MVKFCETRFAQTKLMVYKNFEKSYKTLKLPTICAMASPHVPYP